MKAKFHIFKRVVDLENPKNMTKEERIVEAAIDDQFELEGGVYVFKLLAARANGVQIEYDRQYSVKDEHRGYEYNAIFYIGEPKIVNSMWGRQQVSYTITYLGFVNSDSKESE